MLRHLTGYFDNLLFLYQHVRAIPVVSAQVALRSDKVQTAIFISTSPLVLVTIRVETVSASINDLLT